MYSETNPWVSYKRLDLNPEERIPDDLIKFINRADTVFIGTVFNSDEVNRVRYPPHLGMNIRGGRPGFIRVVPSDGRTVVLPDYSGVF